MISVETPAHWEVVIGFMDDCSVIWRVVASTEKQAVAHVRENLVPKAAEDRGAGFKCVSRTKHVQGHIDRYEVAS